MDLVSPHPFWPEIHGRCEIYPTLQHAEKCDVVVLGAGISGALISERLSREGMDVVVLDKRPVAAGSTSASTALLQYEIDRSLVELTAQYGRDRAERAYWLCHDSIDNLKRLLDEFTTGPELIRPKASLYMASTAQDAAELAQEFDARRRAGLSVEFLTEADISSRFSFRRPAALLTSQAAEIDPYRTTQMLLRCCAERGARIYERSVVTHLEPSADGIRLKTSDGVEVRAKHAVFATGYESQSYLPFPVVDLKSTYAIASQPMEAFPGWWERCLIWETTEPYLYLRTTPDGRAIVGGEDDDFRDPTLRDALVETKASILGEKFRALFPQIRMQIEHQWAGTFGETKDGLAYIGSVRQWPFCQFALGFGGNGIVFSVIAADLIAGKLLGRTVKGAEVFAFDR